MKLKVLKYVDKQMVIGKKILINVKVLLERNIIGYQENLCVKTKDKTQIFMR